jgi:hypothetical protein
LHDTRVLGSLSPADGGEILTLDYVTASGSVTSHHVTVDPSGAFKDELAKPNGTVVLVRAIFAGTMANASAVTETVPTPI